MRFRYVDIIRRPDGTLRPWEEHDILAKNERYYDNTGRFEGKVKFDEARVIKDHEERSRFQSTLSKVCNKA